MSLDQRVHVLRRLNNSQSCRTPATEVGCGKTQIGRIRSNQMAIMLEWEAGG